jgi:hypothetical protein
MGRFILLVLTRLAIRSSSQHGSSVAYSVEDLRDPEFTSKYSTAPSIMDYARFIT